LFVFLQAHAKEIVKQRGLQQITVEDLVREITPRGRGKFGYSEY